MAIDGNVSRSTQWARDNKEKIALRDREKSYTLKGKCINLCTQSKYRTKLTGLEHELTAAFIECMFYDQEGLCALSGIKMTIRGERGSDEYWRSVSLDRIDSSIGYTKNNVQLVCTGVNYMKKDMSDKMFIEFCRLVTENSHE